MRAPGFIFAAAALCLSAAPVWSASPGTHGASSHWGGHGARAHAFATGHHGFASRRIAGRHGWSHGERRFGHGDSWAPSFVYRDTGPVFALAPIETDRVLRLPTRADLPTQADLPQAGRFAESQVSPPALFVIDDETHGRSGKPGGARVYSTARVAELGDGFASSSGAARIITLKAR